MCSFRQIRALYDEDTITVYQAYSASIADAAVKAQCLSASPDFNLDRGFTWIKPSWSWMMYRSGYSFKDDHQARILAIRMKHAHFQELLSHAAVTHEKLTSEEKSRLVRVQWDPERTPKLGMLPYRSVQIGIGRGISQRWINEWIQGIEDVTEKARALKEALEGAGRVKTEELVESGLMPRERVYEVPEELRMVLKMDKPKKGAVAPSDDTFNQF